ncbi:VIT1/CCC1 transporter family protein [Candidatus Woesearchaeota archaeon]|nr:VIT1/CCC1 transporter family protein [Candidatus Woesearchaeota archaeon]
MDVMLQAQRNEITEYQIYHALANKVNDSHNRKILERIAKDELRHYRLLKKYTHQEVKPDRWRVNQHLLLASILGVTFSLRFMEKGEVFAQKLYHTQKTAPFDVLLLDEQKHEKALIGMLHDQRIAYAGSIVLGLNDALVELTGALAGLSLALANGKLVAIIGSITGFAAALSMAASEYLSSKEEKETEKKALTGAIYTGVAYLVTVALLILPFLLLTNVMAAMVIMLSTTIAIIAFYTFYIATAKGTRFWPRFVEMSAISLGVALISFFIGWLVRAYIGVDV